MKYKVGLPRALHYYKYHVFWKSFLEGLGCEIIESPQSNRAILKRGTELAVDESCLSVKLYLGHVDYLKDKVDFIFIPRLVSFRRNEWLCVKFMALSEIVRNTFPNVKILSYSIALTELKLEMIEIVRMSLRLTKNPARILSAFFRAKTRQKEYDRKKIIAQEREIRARNKKVPTILVVAHPYTTHDSLLGKPIISFLRSQGVNIIFSDIIEAKKARMLSKRISPGLYWTYNKELLGAVEYYKSCVDGIIFLMVFPCGPDALVVNLCQLKMKDIPLTVITLDEHQGEAGLKTRLESFVDILKLKKQHGGQK